MPDVTKLLEQDHRELEGYFAEFRSSQDANVAATICEELDAHASAEEQAVYPAFADESAELKKLVKEGEAEHGKARQLIGRIKQTTDPEHLAELVGQLEGAVNHHVQDEESEMFPKARDEIDPARLGQIADDFRAAKG
jgi:hemerythrin superfamily protein